MIRRTILSLVTLAAVSAPALAAQNAGTTAVAPTTAHATMAAPAPKPMAKSHVTKVSHKSHLKAAKAKKKA